MITQTSKGYILVTKSAMCMALYTHPIHDKEPGCKVKCYILFTLNGTL